MTEKPTNAGRIIALILGLVLCAVFAEIALRILMPQWSEFYSVRFMQVIDDERFGPVVIGNAGFDGWFAQNNGDFRVHIHINDFGLRNDQPVEAAADATWFVGDSMTFGWGVEEDQRYSTVVGQLLGRPKYNVASPGTDVCGYRSLVSRMPATIRPSAVVIGLVLENDLAVYDCATRTKIDRPSRLPSLIAFKVWLTGHSALYNFLTVSLKKVDFVRQAMTAIGLINQEQAYKRFFEPDEIAAVTASTADTLAELCRDLPKDTPCAVLVMPARFEIAYDDKPYRDARLAINNALSERGINVIDPFDAFKAAGFKATHFVHDGHWSPLGHQIAAEAVAQWLRQQARP